MKNKMWQAKIHLVVEADSQNEAIDGIRELLTPSIPNCNVVDWAYVHTGEGHNDPRPYIPNEYGSYVEGDFLCGRLTAIVDTYSVRLWLRAGEEPQFYSFSNVYDAYEEGEYYIINYAGSAGYPTTTSFRIRDIVDVSKVIVISEGPRGDIQ